MPVSRHQLYNELRVKLTHDHEVRDNFADICDEVVEHWKSLAPKPGERYAPDKGGYATGAYRASIHRESIRATKAEGGNAGGWASRAVTYSEIAHFLEYGTQHDDAPNYPDPPNEYGHWVDLEGEEHWHWNTPTPAFAFAADTENSFSSMVSTPPKAKRRRPRAPAPPPPGFKRRPKSM